MDVEEPKKKEQKSRVERFKDLIHVIGRSGLTEDQMTEAIKDVGLLIIKEKLGLEEVSELKKWIGEGGK